MEHIVILKHAKSTKGTHVYEAQPGSPPVVKVVYVERWCLSDPAPTHIQLTVKAMTNGN